MDKEALMVAGIDVDDALRRFMGNENLFKRMLSKFLNDTTINDLRNGICYEYFPPVCQLFFIC